MTRLSLLSAALLFTLVAFAQSDTIITGGLPDDIQVAEEPAPGNAMMQFEKTEHDFGKINDSTVVEYSFKFKNTGTAPLIVQEARGSCGCTVPEYPLHPIEVGEEAEILVSFNPYYKSGIQEKIVNIVANTNPPVTTLSITSEVIPDWQITPSDTQETSKKKKKGPKHKKKNRELTTIYPRF